MPKAHAVEIHPVQMTKNLEGRLPRPSTGPQICQAPGQEGTGRLLCITGAQDHTQSRKLHRHSVLETYFQKLFREGSQPTSCNSWISGI